MSKNQEKPSIAIIDHGIGSWRSAQTALQRVGAVATRTADPDTILATDALVLPGVGAFPAAMERLDERGLIGPLNEFKDSGKPILGICLGMQLLFETSSEHCAEGEFTKGLGWIEGGVTKWRSNRRRLNMGWAQVKWAQQSKLGQDITGEDSSFYHMHTHVCEPRDKQVIAAVTWIDPVYVSAVEQDNLYGVQFHPESSGQYPGLHLLKNFVEICGSSEAGL